LPTAAPFVATAPWKALFDGTGTSFNQWTRVSPNNSNGFALINDEIVTYGTRDFGLLYYAAEAFADFTLRVQFRIFDLQNHNSGIFVRFRDPLLDLTPETLSSMVNESAREKSFRPDLSSDMELFQGNRAWSAVHSGFEIQIDDTAKGDPRKDFYGVPENQFDSSGGLRKNRTGAIYKIPAKDFIPHTGAFDAELQTYNPAPNLVPQIWYEFEIDVRGDTYTIDLTNLSDGVKTRTTTFVNVNPVRGIATANGQSTGYIGLQSYPGAQLAFRQIQIKP